MGKDTIAGVDLLFVQLFNKIINIRRVSWPNAMTVQIKILLTLINNLSAVFVDDILNQRCKKVSFDTIADKILLCDREHFYVV